MDWYLQPFRGTINLAQVVPAIIRPWDLDVMTGQPHVDYGIPHKPVGLVATSFDEWLFTIVPGHGTVVTDLSLDDDLEINGTWVHDFAGTDTLPAPNRGEVKGTTIAATDMVVSDGTYVGPGRLYLVPGSRGWGSDDHLNGWRAWVTFAADDDWVILYPWEDDIGIRFKRTSSDILFAETIGLLGGVTVTSTGHSFQVDFAQPIEIGCGVPSYTGCVPDVWGNVEGTWYIAEHWALNEINPASSAVLVGGTAAIHKLANICCEEAICTYTLPEYGYGSWDDPAYFKKSVVTGSGRMLSPREIRVQTAVYDAATTSVTVLEINGTAVVLADYLETIEGNIIHLAKSIPVDATVEVTYQSFEPTTIYGGYKDIWGTSYSGDFNWLHPWSPLADGEIVYLYARPTFVNTNAWKVQPSRYAGLVHRTRPAMSKAMQLVAVIGVPVQDKPLIVDLRTPPPAEAELGVWDKDASFEGPTYPEGGVVIVQVDETRVADAREVTEHSVAAGIRALVEGA